METVVEVIGVNGDVVTIAGEDTGVDGISLDPEFQGFFDPVVETNRKPVANRPGAKYLGFRYNERTLTFSVTIENGEGAGCTWRERDSRWRRLWEYGQYTTLRFTTDETQRSIRVMLDEIEVDTKFDPHVNDATTVAMTVIADDPFYYGPEFVQSFTVSAGVWKTLKIPRGNPGDVPTFTEWVLEAPGTWALPDNDLVEGRNRSVTLPALSAGEHLTVNTDPGSRQLIAANNTPVWARMNGVRFRNPIPAGTGPLELKVRCDRSSSGQLRIKRRYTRPWGLD